MKISAAGGELRVTDYFTMHDTVDESEQDEDIGSGGIVLLPDLKDVAGRMRHLAVGAGKDQIIYVVDRDSMGKFHTGGERVFERNIWAIGGMEFGAPLYFDGSVYYGAYKDSLRAFRFLNATLPRLLPRRHRRNSTIPGQRRVFPHMATRMRLCGPSRILFPQFCMRTGRMISPLSCTTATRLVRETSLRTTNSSHP